MKAIFIFFLPLLVCTNLTYSQELSHEEKLAATGKVWGFLKYYHPQVAAGKFDWDQELFNILPQIKETTDKADFSTVLLAWIEPLGKIKSKPKPSDQEHFDKNFGLDWLDNKQWFTEELSAKLRLIEANRHQGKKHYVSYSYDDYGFATFTNEKDHPDLGWEKEEVRILALFRYWNIIEYFFPYKYQIDTDWDLILEQMITKFLAADSETKFHLAMLELIAAIDDSHGSFVTKQTFDHFGSQFVPFQTTFVNSVAVITGFRDDALAELNGLQKGDVILSVDGTSILGHFRSNRKYIMGSNDAVKFDRLGPLIFRGNTSSVNLEILRGEEVINLTVGRYPYKQFVKSSIKELAGIELLEDSIGYINFSGANEAELAGELQKLSGTKALIIDLRNPPKNTRPVLMDFVCTEQKVFSKSLYPDLNYPGKFVWKEREVEEFSAGPKYQGKVILIVNHRTQSNAEFTAMGLQSGENVITVGSQTSGADGSVSNLKMLGGYDTRFTGVGIFYPDGTETQRVGVKIDVEVKQTVEGVLEGRDELLEKALEIANE